MLDSVSIGILVVMSMLIPLLGYTFCDGAALLMAYSKEWSSLNYECFSTTNLLIQSLCSGGFFFFLIIVCIGYLVTLTLFMGVWF